MKNSKQTIVITAIMLFTVSTFFTACKKGDGDPVISLKSRKAKVEGEWKVTKYENKGDFKITWSGNTSTYTWNDTYDGTTWTSNSAWNGTPSPPSTSTVTFTYSFAKDGTYKKHKENTPTGSSYKNIYDEEGTWNFLAGVGETKNKERIALIVTKQIWTSTSPGSTPDTETYTGRTGLYSTWQLTTLKSKEMIVYAEDSDTEGDGSYNRNETTDMTLTQ